MKYSNSFARIGFFFERKLSSTSLSEIDKLPSRMSLMMSVVRLEITLGNRNKVLGFGEVIKVTFNSSER